MAFRLTPSKTSRYSETPPHENYRQSHTCTRLPAPHASWMLQCAQGSCIPITGVAVRALPEPCTLRPVLLICLRPRQTLVYSSSAVSWLICSQLISKLMIAELTAWQCNAGLHSTGSMYTSYPLSPTRSTSAQVAPGAHAHRTTSYSSAAPTSAPASPTRIDGKEFFRQAR